MVQPEHCIKPALYIFLRMGFNVEEYIDLAMPFCLRFTLPTVIS